MRLALFFNFSCSTLTVYGMKIFMQHTDRVNNSKMCNRLQELQMMHKNNFTTAETNTFYCKLDAYTPPRVTQHTVRGEHHHFQVKLMKVDSNI